MLMWNWKILLFFQLNLAETIEKSAGFLNVKFAIPVFIIKLLC